MKLITVFSSEFSSANLSFVAQIFNLLYRRVALGRTTKPLETSILLYVPARDLFVMRLCSHRKELFG